ncbi:MAG: indole-3-glycerol phosphate synthase TrpC [Chthonomonadaceae bacterium]|nr:indole-3-glycerol phosphate synthase TrpC [Chthonomonadaceae bacterium]
MTILDEILAHKRDAVKDTQIRRPLAELKAEARDVGPTRGFLRALSSEPKPMGLIAEVKKASPSRGVIRADFDPVGLAKSYEDAGATCLSVLTDERYFQGSTDNLVQCRAATKIPVLRKDFTVSEYHVYEARLMGADAILLIVHGLSNLELRELYLLSIELGMDALVEVHTLVEAELAIELGAQLIGVNNRDLATFEESMTPANQVLPTVSQHALAVSESSLRSLDDVTHVGGLGARAVLIGTEFCASLDPGRRVKEVMGW